jgi:twitching motility protein PilT
MQLNSKDGMQNLDQALTELVRDNIVSQEEAMAKSSNPERLTKMLQFQFSAQAF